MGKKEGNQGLSPICEADEFASLKQQEFWTLDIACPHKSKANKPENR